MNIKDMEKKTGKFSIDKLPKGAIIGILILLPCIGFLLGMEYQKDIDGRIAFYPTTPVQQMPPTAVPTNPPQQLDNTCQTDNDCVLYNPEAANNSTLCCQNQNMLCTIDQTKITAVNKSAYEQQVKNLCKSNTVCPMYRAICPQAIQQSIQTLKAKCVQNICQKTN